MTGAATVTVELGGTYTELGATATDASGTVTVVTSGTVDTDTVGHITHIHQLMLLVMYIQELIQQHQ